MLNAKIRKSKDVAIFENMAYKISHGFYALKRNVFLLNMLCNFFHVSVISLLSVITLFSIKTLFSITLHFKNKRKWVNTENYIHEIRPITAMHRNTFFPDQFFSITYNSLHLTVIRNGLWPIPLEPNFLLNTICLEICAYMSKTKNFF